MTRTLLLSWTAALAACTAPRALVREDRELERVEPAQEGTPLSPQQQQEEEEFFAALAEAQRPRWIAGQALMQGFVGVGYPESVTLDPGVGDEVEIDDGELDNLPVIGGGMQLKLAGEDIDFGVEAMMSFAFRSDLQAFAVGGGGAVIALDVDVLVFDLFGGPFVSKLFADRVRVYAGAGPIIQFVEYSQSDDSGAEDADSDAFGSGYYGRGGVEFLLPGGTLVGFGVRYSATQVDLGNDLGDFDLEGVQALITVSRSD